MILKIKGFALLCKGGVAVVYYIDSLGYMYGKIAILAVPASIEDNNIASAIKDVVIKGQAINHNIAFDIIRDQGWTCDCEMDLPF